MGVPLLLARSRFCVGRSWQDVRLSIDLAERPPPPATAAGGEAREISIHCLGFLPIEQARPSPPAAPAAPSIRVPVRSRLVLSWFR